MAEKVTLYDSPISTISAERESLPLYETAPTRAVKVPSISIVSADEPLVGDKKYKKACTPNTILL